MKWNSEKSGSPVVTYRAPSRLRVPPARVGGITPASNWLLLLLIVDHADRSEPTGFLPPNHVEYIHCLLQMAKLILYRCKGTRSHGRYRICNPELSIRLALLRRLVAGFPSRQHGFDPRWSHVGFVVDKVALGQVASKYFGFPCQFSFYQILHTHLSSGAGTVGQSVANVPSGLSFTPPNETRTIYSPTYLPTYLTNILTNWFNLWNSLEGAHRMLVCYAVPYINVTSTTFWRRRHL
jgi:hypothetical protein